jgi:hypothetical protein
MSDVDRRQVLTARRERLVRHAAEQRLQLARAAAPLAVSWHRFERVLMVWRSVRRQPWLVVAPLTLLALWRPRWGTRALAAALPLLWRAGQLADWPQRRRTP